MKAKDGLSEVGGHRSHIGDYRVERPGKEPFQAIDEKYLHQIHYEFN